MASGTLCTVELLTGTLCTVRGDSPGDREVERYGFAIGTECIMNESQALGEIIA